MSTLPLLVVRGAVVWKVVLAAIVAGVLALVAWRRRRVARAGVREAVHVLSAKTELGVVRGTLGGAGAATVVATTKASLVLVGLQRGDELWIDTGDGRVALEGEVRVDAGSRAFAARNGVPAATPQPLIDRDATFHRKTRWWCATLAQATLARVAAGDEVIAYGQLATVAARAETDARTNAAVQVLRPLDDGAPIALVARQPRAATPRLTFVALAVIAGGTALGGWLTLRGLGEHWRKACWDLGARDRYGALPAGPPAEPIELSNTHVCALAAAMPESRTSALRGSLDLVTSGPYRDREALDRVVALAQLSGDPCGGVRELVAAERYEDAAALAYECGDRRAEHLALVQLGRYDEAAALPVASDVDGGMREDALPTAQTLILAGRWTDAAAAAERHADEVLARSSGEQDTRHNGELAARSFHCLAEYLRYAGGEGPALDRLRALARGHGALCAPELAELVPAQELAELLAAPSDATVFDQPAVLSALQEFAGSGDSFEMPAAETVLAQPDDLEPAGGGYRIWLAETAPPAPPELPASARLDLERWQTVATVLGDDLAAAKAHAARAALLAASGEITDRHGFRYTSLLPSLVSFYTGGDVDYAIPADPLSRELWLHDFGRLLLRKGAPLVAGTYFGPQSNYPGALEAAAHGDGTRLLAFIGGASALGAWWHDADIIAVLPRIETGRADVVRQLVWSSPLDAMRLEFGFPFASALHAGARRLALQLAGEPAEAARWGEIYKRIDQALRDRRKVIALALWSR